MNAFRSLLSLFRPSRTSRGYRPGRRPQTVSLGIEMLEDRLTPSASSNFLQAVAVPSGGSAAFFINPGDHFLYEKKTDGQVVLLYEVSDTGQFSAGLDAQGRADVFAKLGNTMWEHTDDGWTNIGQPAVGLVDFAAVKGGRCYGEGGDNSLWEYLPAHQVQTTIYNPLQHRDMTFTYQVPAGWTQLWAANAVWGLDAVTQANGVDAVFVQGGDAGLREYSQGTWKSIDTPAYNGPAFTPFQAFTVGLSTDGRASVFLVEDDGSVLRLDDTVSQGYVPQLPSGNLTLHATTNGMAFYTTYDSDHGSALQRVNTNGSVTTIAANGFTINQLSAATSNDVYVLTEVGLKENIDGSWYSY